MFLKNYFKIEKEQFVFIIGEYLLNNIKSLKQEKFKLILRYRR